MERDFEIQKQIVNAAHVRSFFVLDLKLLKFHQHYYYLFMFLQDIPFPCEINSYQRIS